MMFFFVHIFHYRRKIRLVLYFHLYFQIDSIVNITIHGWYFSFELIISGQTNTYLFLVTEQYTHIYSIKEVPSETFMQGVCFYRQTLFSLQSCFIFFKWQPNIIFLVLIPENFSEKIKIEKQLSNQ